MKKLILASILAMTMSPSAFAMSNQEAIKTVHQATAMQYCGFEDEHVIRTGGEVFVIYSTTGIPTDEDGITECSGGSGTYMTHLAHLKNGRVIKADLFEDHDINTRFIDTDSLSVSNGILSFQNREFGKNDPNCCAGDIYNTQIQLSTGRLISRKFVGRAPE